MGEQAVLRIVADEIRAHGNCSAFIDAIAARAGVSRSTAQRAIRQARALGLITVQERRRAGQPSLPNIIRAIDKGWLAWLRLGGRGDGGRVSEMEHRGQQAFEEEERRGQSNRAGAL